MSDKAEKKSPVCYEYKGDKMNTYEDDEWARNFMERRRRDDLIRDVVKYGLPFLISGILLLYALWLELGIGGASLSVVPQIWSILQRLKVFK